jgi:hypothetical protein
VGAAVIHGPIHQLEDFAAQAFSVPLVRRQVFHRVLALGAGSLLGAAAGQQHQREHGSRSGRGH